MIRFLGLTAILLALTLPAAGQAADAVDELSLGPGVGSKIPHNLMVPDHKKQERDFKAIAHSRGLVILFSRSLDW